MDVSTEELLSAERALTYVDLYAMSGNQNAVLWLTPHAAVARESERLVHYWLQLNRLYRFSFSADGKDMVALARPPERCSSIDSTKRRSTSHSTELGSSCCIYHRSHFGVSDGALSKYGALIVEGSKYG